MYARNSVQCTVCMISRAVLTGQPWTYSILEHHESEIFVWKVNDYDNIFEDIISTSLITSAKNTVCREADKR